MSKEAKSESNLVPFIAPSGSSAPIIRPVPHFEVPTTVEREITFSDLYHALIQRWILISAITGVTMLLMGIFCATRDPLYSARATIEIRGYAPVLAGATVENLFGADTRKLEYQKTTIAKLKQPGIADRVLSHSNQAKEIASYFNIELREPPPEHGQSTSANAARFHGLQQSAKLIALYLSTIDINPVSETSLTQIDVTTKDPHLSMVIANEHAEGFIETLRVERQESMRTNLKALEAQTEELKSKLAKAEEEIAVYSEQNQLIVGSGADTKDVTVQKIVSLSGLLSQATGKRVQSENLYNQLKDAPSLGSSSLDNEAIQQWRFELNKLEADYKTLGQRVTDEYPEMIDIRNKMSALKNSIQNERKQQLQALALTLDSERAAEQRLTAQITEVESQVHDNLKKMARYTILRKEADSLRELYEAVLKQLQETTVSAASGVSNIYVSDWASEPQSPSYPRTGFMLTVATVVGLGIGIILAWALEFFDNRIKGAEEASTVSSLPLLGSIPAFDNGIPSAARTTSDRMKKLIPFTKGELATKTSGSEKSVVVKATTNGTQVPPAVSEALRTIRAGLLLSSVDAPLKVILVTSSDKGEGKTTGAANLAMSLAQAEYRTLLVDADLRETSIAKLFPELRNRPGLSDLIAGQSDADATICKNVTPFLDVLGAGSKPPNPAELVGSRRMSDAVTQMRARYDFVIIDSPPVLPVADSLMLSSVVDGIVLVVRGGKSLRRNLKEAKRRLASVRAHLVGIILNESNTSREPVYGNRDNSAYFTVVDSETNQADIGPHV